MTSFRGRRFTSRFTTLSRIPGRLDELSLAFMVNSFILHIFTIFLDFMGLFLYFDYFHGPGENSSILLSSQHESLNDFFWCTVYVERVRDSGLIYSLAPFCCDCNRKDEFVTLYPADVVLFEGILMFYSQEIRDLFQMKLFVDTDPDTRLSRRGTCLRRLEEHWFGFGFI